MAHIAEDKLTFVSHRICFLGHGSGPASCRCKCTGHHGNQGAWWLVLVLCSGHHEHEGARSQSHLDPVYNHISVAFLFSFLFSSFLTSINPSLAVPLPVQSNRINLPTLVYGNTSHNKHNRQNEVLVLRRCSHRPCWPRKCTNPSLCYRLYR